MLSNPHNNLWICGTLCLLQLSACRSAPPTSTRMTGDDLDTISTELAASLAAAEVIANRTPDSPPWVITINKVRNLTSDVMTESEQWAVMARIRSSLPIRSLWDTKNIRLVIPAERTRHIQHDPSIDPAGDQFGRQRRPTHVMTATFRSVTRASAQGRTDLYYCQFDLIDLDHAQPIWSDRFEYKRTATGHPWD